ncbi:MAG: T9SS type A sorting domain-containing protein, partial [Bacteroidota bacterium]
FSLGNTKDESLFRLLDGNEINFINIPDFESPQDANADNEYLIDITARDASGNARTQQVTIFVLDVDEVPPMFTSSNTSSSVENNLEVIYTIEANEEASFTLGNTKDESLFSLTNGNEIRFIESPDFERPLDSNTDNVYELDVIATDQAGNSSTLALTITITDIDDTAPVITSAGSGSINENAEGIAYVATANEEVVFSLGSSLDESFFEVANNSEISFNNAPDFEDPKDANADNVYEIRIQAVDLAGNTSSILVEISVIDITDETPPTFTSSNEVTFEENRSGVAYSITADEVATFSLGNSKDEGLFTIANNNEVSFNNAPDFEDPQDADANNTYLLDIIATDAASNTTTLALTITVTDVDDDPLGISSSNFEDLSVYPNPIINERVTIDFNEQISGELTVFDTQGRVVKTTDIASQSIVLDLRKELPGLYLIQIQTREGKKANVRLLKR